MQPMKEQPPPGAKCKDKFLVCSAEIPVEKESMALTEYVSERRQGFRVWSEFLSS